MRKLSNLDRLEGMSMNEQQLIEEVLKLPEDAQQRVLEAIEDRQMAHMNPEHKAALVKIAKTRLDDYRAGRSKTITAKESIQKAREFLNARIKQSNNS